MDFQHFNYPEYSFPKCPENNTLKRLHSNLSECNMLGPTRRDLTLNVSNCILRIAPVLNYSKIHVCITAAMRKLKSIHFKRKKCIFPYFFSHNFRCLYIVAVIIILPYQMYHIMRWRNISVFFFQVNQGHVCWQHCSKALFSRILLQLCWYFPVL